MNVAGARTINGCVGPHVSRMKLTTGAAARATDEIELVARAAAGDRGAYEHLIVSRVDRALRTARAILRSDVEAHDAVQDVLVAAWVNLPRLRDGSRFDAWLHRMLVNRCREGLRQRRRHRETRAEADASLPDFSGGSVETASVKAAFGRLSVEQRTILLLHHLHGSLERALEAEA